MKFKALTLMLAATLLAAVLPIGSAGGPVQPPVVASTLYVGEIGWGPAHADPVRAYDTRSCELLFNVYDRLISFGSPVTNSYGLWDVEEQYWEFEPALATNIPTRQEVILPIPDMGINPFDPVSFWFPVGPIWYHIEGWVDSNPDGILGPCDVLYIGEYQGPGEPIQAAMTIRTWHVFDYAPGIQLLVHHYYYDFSIRQDVQFFDSTGDIIDTFDIADAEYSFERGLVQDQYGSPMWMFYEPLFGQMNSDWLQGAVDPVTASWFMSLLVKDAFEDVGGNLLRINVGIPFSDMSFKQILCGTWASILSKQWCLNMGCWNGNLFEDIAPPDGIPDWYMTWRHTVASPIDAVNPANYAGSGPYRVIVASQVLNLVIMQYNPDHWRGWPANQRRSYLEYIDIEYIEDWITMLTMFEACQLDIIEVPRSHSYELLNPFGDPTIPEIKTIKNITPSLMLDAVFYCYNVNPQSPAIYTGQFPDGIPPDFFSNKDCREAVGWAFNHTKYLEQTWYKEATCRDTPDIAGLVPDYYTWGPDPPYFYDYNLEQLYYALQRAMFTQGSETKSVWDWGGFHFTIFYNAGNEERRIACEMIRDTFNLINAMNGTNFQITIQSLSWPTFMNYMENQMMPVFVTGWQGDYADADNFKRSFMHSQGFFPYYQGYTSATWGPLTGYLKDDLIDLAAKTPDGPTRALYYDDLDRIYIIDMPSFPIAQPIGRKWMKYWVKGWYYNALYGGSLQAFQGTGDYYYKMYKNDTCWADITGPENPPGSGQYPPDGVVNMRDVSYIAGHFGGKAPNPGAIPPTPIYDPKWAPGTYGCGGCDVVGDRKIDMRDIAFAASHFLHTNQP